MEWNKFRRASGLLEWACSHGVGHPDHKSVEALNKKGMKGFGVHGCDGCCGRDDFPPSLPMSKYLRKLGDFKDVDIKEEE